MTLEAPGFERGYPLEAIATHPTPKGIRVDDR